MHAQVVTLTPEKAREMLQKNIDNRPLSRAVLTKYAAAIKRGEWQLNGEPIIIFDDGRLGDGQHRCHAVIQAGIPIQTLVVYGAPNTAFKTIDAGKSRAASDVLSINGKKNVNVLAAAARGYLLEYLSGSAKDEITSAQILECVELHPHINFWVSKYVTSEKIKASVSSVFCGLLAVASERYGIEKMQPFFDGVAEGVGLGLTDPAYVLRERMSRESGSKLLTTYAKRAYMVKAMNAFILGKSMSKLTWKDKEEMPKIV